MYLYQHLQQHLYMYWDVYVCMYICLSERTPHCLYLTTLRMYMTSINKVYLYGIVLVPRARSGQGFLVLHQRMVALAVVAG